MELQNHTMLNIRNCNVYLFTPPYVRDHPTMDDLDFYQITRAAGQIENLLGEGVALRFFSTNGANPTSPGHRPGFRVPVPLSPEGAEHVHARRLSRPFRALVIFTPGYPGRCPGLG